MTPAILEKDIVDERLLNSEEYRKIVYNTLIPDIKKSAESKRTHISIACIFSKEMINFLEKKGFNVMITNNGGGSVYTRIEW